GRLTEQVERLAHHAHRGELREKAVHYLRQAGLKAAARSALQDARTWLEQALGVLEALAGEPVHAGAGLRDPPGAAAGAAPVGRIPTGAGAPARGRKRRRAIERRPPARSGLC